ncbi:hypothetical protein C8J57DRAFT_716984 [Mycena rebaudengoi]|nr:hypothetical protein C8J57DRAFT_716984 [Mycena rebaudengoi]
MKKSTISRALSRCVPAGHRYYKGWGLPSAALPPSPQNGISPIPLTSPLTYSVAPLLAHDDPLPSTLTSPIPPSRNPKSIFAFWHSGMATLPPNLLRDVIAWYRRCSPLGWTIYVLDTVPGSPLNISHYIDTSSPAVVPAAWLESGSVLQALGRRVQSFRASVGRSAALADIMSTSGSEGGASVVSTSPSAHAPTPIAVPRSRRSSRASSKGHNIAGHPPLKTSASTTFSFLPSLANLVPTGEAAEMARSLRDQDSMASRTFRQTGGAGGLCDFHYFYAR